MRLLKHIVIVILLLLVASQADTDFVTFFPNTALVTVPDPLVINKIVGKGTNPLITGFDTDNSINVMAHNGQCTLAATTGNTHSNGTIDGIGSPTGFKVLGGLRCRHCGLMASDLSSAPTTPTVTSVGLITGEAHTFGAGGGSKTATASSTFTEDYDMTQQFGHAEFQRTLLNSAAAIGSYTVDDSTGIYTAQTSGMTTNGRSVFFNYFTPTTDGTSYFYKTIWIDKKYGTTPASVAASTATGATTLGVTYLSAEAETLSPSPNGVAKTFTFTLGKRPLLYGSVTITFSNGVVAYDNGNGGFFQTTGVDVGGTVNYTTGAVSIVLTAAPAGGVTATGAYRYERAVDIRYGQPAGQQVTSEPLTLSPAPNGSAVIFTAILAHPNVLYNDGVAGHSTVITFSNSNIITDNGGLSSGQGAFTGASLDPTTTSTENYQSGVVRIIFSSAPAPGVTATATYQWTSAMAVGIYRSTDGGSTYAQYFSQPLYDVTGMPLINFIDKGRGLGPYWTSSIVDAGWPATPPTTEQADDVITQITNCGENNIHQCQISTFTVNPPLSQTVTGAPILEDDTQAIHDSWAYALAQNKPYVDVPHYCRIDYINVDNYPDLYTFNGVLKGTLPITIRGNHTSVNEEANIIVAGTGNGGCISPNSGAIELFPNGTARDFYWNAVDVNAPGGISTNYELGCGISYAPEFGISSSPTPTLQNVGDFIITAQNGQIASACPNCTALNLAFSNSGFIEGVRAWKNKRVIYDPRNMSRILGPGTIGYQWWSNQYIILAPLATELQINGMTLEVGPNFINIGSNLGGTTGVIGNYMADTVSGYGSSNFLDLGIQIPVMVGSYLQGSLTPEGMMINNNLIQGGQACGISVSGIAQVAANSFINNGTQFALQQQAGICISDATNNGLGKHNSILVANNRIAAYMIDGIQDTASSGTITIKDNGFEPGGGMVWSVDLSHSTDSGEISECVGNDSSANGIYDPTGQLNLAWTNRTCGDGTVTTQVFPQIQVKSTPTVVGLPTCNTAAQGTQRGVLDSTAVAAEGQTCVGGSTHYALAICADGNVWKCF